MLLHQQCLGGLGV